MVGGEKCKAEKGFGEKSRMKRQDGGDVGHGEGEKREGGGIRKREREEGLTEVSVCGTVMAVRRREP